MSLTSGRINHLNKVIVSDIDIRICHLYMTSTAGHADIVDTYYILHVSWRTIVIRRLSNDKASTSRCATLERAIAKFSDWISSLAEGRTSCIINTWSVSIQLKTLITTAENISMEWYSGVIIVYDLTFLEPADVVSFPVLVVLQCLVHDMSVSVVVAYGWEFSGKISNPF